MTAFSIRHERFFGRITDGSYDHDEQRHELNGPQQTLLQPADDEIPNDGATRSVLPVSSYSALLDAIDVMQSHYFRIWPGIWPTAIDWTAAVMGTQVSATLFAITDSLGHKTQDEDCIDFQQSRRHENIINQYFTQIASFYHGENAFSLRTQAYDDMLWVVLGWLESVKFIHRHSELHYTSRHPTSASEGANTSIWYAQQFTPQFAHRARVFYDLAAKGWDTSLCGGGVVWNPHLAPYKNAITNQLFISASLAMYLYFPGDDNASPFSTFTTQYGDDGMNSDDGGSAVNLPAKAHDSRYLSAAIAAYDWLKHSNMTNDLGLYIDGFHIAGWRGGSNSSNGSGQCDVRDEKVYTYNQGVILSGLRGLYDATGKSEYLEDGHNLIMNVILATGWIDRENERRTQWRGLGRGGVMEEACDVSGSCSQNGQTFKGIWWMHFTKFCQPLENGSENKEVAMLHYRSCRRYKRWVEWNAKAAYATRDKDGKFGEWWGKHDWPGSDDDLLEPVRDQGTDYRNEGVPENEVWRSARDAGDGVGYHDTRGRNHAIDDNEGERSSTWDLNDRGRGRTVETQSGGLAVVRALYRWERWFSEEL